MHFGDDDLKRAGGQRRRGGLQVLCLFGNGQPAEGTGYFTAAVHLLSEKGVVIRSLLGGLDDGFSLFDGGPAHAQIASDVVAGVHLSFCQLRRADRGPPGCPAAGGPPPFQELNWPA